MSARRWVSDQVVDLLADAGIEHVAFNPGASFRGLHDSLVHRAGGPTPILCLHEGVAVAVAHGYAKATGRPMAVALHDVVGLQNASMAIYNAWCDRVPVLLIGGTGPLATPERRPWIDWIHTANVQGQAIRDYVKWDDQPADADSIPAAFARALALASAEPAGPVYMCLDAALQEQEAGEEWAWPWAPATDVPTPPGAVDRELDDLADHLSFARLPVLMADYAGDTEEGYAALNELAQLLHAPVLDLGARMNFARGHELDFGLLPEVLGESDFVLAIDVEDLGGPIARARASGWNAPITHLTTRHLRVRSWAHDVGEMVPSVRTVSGSAQVALPALVARLRAAPIAQDLLAHRRETVGPRAKEAHARRWQQARAATAEGMLHPDRAAAELWDLLADERPVLVHSRPFDPERALWPLAGFGAHLGMLAGGGLGHAAGHAAGAALGLGGDRLLVNLQPDGDLLFTPSGLWTLAAQRLPVLTIVKDNRRYDNTAGHAATVAANRGRPPGRTDIGATFDDPPIDVVGMARAFGIFATGPAADPAELRTAVRRAVAAVRSGVPALVDVRVA